MAASADLHRDGSLGPPSNDEAEQALLGAILADNRAYDRVSGFLRPEHFADGIHAAVYDACGRLIEAGRAANAVTLKNLFDREDALQDVGGAEYLAQLQANYVTIINAADYGNTIHDLYLRRKLIALGGDLARDARMVALDGDGLSIAENAADLLTGLLESGQREGGLIAMQTLATEVAERTEAIRRGEIEPGIGTGFIDLDRITGGFHAGDLIILAGRPGMGKTALATKIAHNVASKWRHQQDAAGSAAEAARPVAFFSLEMPAEALMRRMACELSGIEFTRTLQAHGLSDDEFECFVEKSLAMRSLPLRIDSTPRLSPAQIHARALGMKRRHGLALVVVDHLGHMMPPLRSNARHLDLGDITKSLKATAKKLDVPVLLLCQLNRGVESRDDKRPTLADLRESGQIEEDADLVLFCYRAAYYLMRQPPQKREGESVEKFDARNRGWENDLQTVSGRGDVIVAKQRNGIVDTVQLAFIERFMRWDNLARAAFGEAA